MLSKGFKKGMAIALSVAMVTGLAPTNAWQTVTGSRVAVVHAEETEKDSTETAPTKAMIFMNYQEEKFFAINKDGLKAEDVFYYQFVNDNKKGEQVAPSPSKWNTAVVDNIIELSDGTNKFQGQCMDLSWLSTSKGQTLYVTFSTDPTVEKPDSLHIPAQVTKLKIDFTGSRPTGGTENDTYIGNDVAGYLTINTAKTDPGVTSFKQLEWRSTNGTWASVIQSDKLNMNLLRYVNKGGNLEFRVQPTDRSPAGKAVKVKFPAKANGPKVTVDSVKQTVVLPAGSEYVLSSDYKVGAAWTPVTAKTTKYFDELCGYTGETDITMFVRNAGVAKKASSKITEVTLKAAEPISSDTVVMNLDGTASTNGKVAVSYVDSGNVGKGLTITNNTQKKFQVALVKKTAIDGKDLTKGSVLKIGDTSNAAFVFKDVNVGAKLKATKIGAKWDETIASGDSLKDYIFLIRTKTGLVPGKILSVNMDTKAVSGAVDSTSAATESESSQIDSSVLEWAYEDASVRVPFGKNKAIYYQFATAEKEPKQWEAIYEQDGLKVTREDGTTNYAVIDFSNLNPAKDNWLYLKGDVDSKVISVKRDKASALKATFKASSAGMTEAQKKFCEDYTSFTDETGYYIFQANGTEMTDGSSIYWKTENGFWRPIRDLNLQLYKYKGAKINFRIQNGMTLDSKPIAVKYAGKGKAVTVKIDGDKLTATLTNKMEYKVKVADGAYSDWIKPDTGTKSSAKVNLAELSGMIGNGDGVSTQWKDTTLQVRTAGTDKKISSNVGMVTLYAPDEPECGSEGVSVDYVNASKPTSGMKFTNKTKQIYQVAMIEGGSDIEAAIAAINLTASSKETGYIKFATVKAGKTATYAYSNYKKFKNPVAVCRIAMIKENSKTPAIEYRLASKIEAVNAGTPICSVSSGIVKIEGDNESATQPIDFTIAKGWTVFYSIDSTMPTVSEEGDVIGGTKYVSTVNQTIEKSKKVTIQAIGVKLNSSGKVEKKGGNTTVVLTGFKTGDTSAYKDRWGYKLCLEEDKANSNTMSSDLYTILYDAIVNQQAEVDISALNVPAANKGILSTISERIRYDNPQLLQYGGKLGYTYSNVVTKVSLQYNQDAATTAQMMSEVEETYQEIVKLALEYGKKPSLENVPDYLKVKAIHDYLVLNNVYHSSAYDQNIYGAMSSKATPVCMSYAMSMVYCCQRMGIECVLVVGKAGGAHAWNLIRLDDANGVDNSDDWYEMDVTWDDPVGGDPDKVHTTYFNVTTDQLNKATKRTRSTQAYTSYPVEKATGTMYNATVVYGYAAAAIYEDVSELINYRCGLELPEILEQ